MSARPTSLEQIRVEGDGRSYPCDVLTGCETALVLFAAGFHGRQDGFWIADAGLRATCVDVDGAKLVEMAEVYPSAWEFVASDAFEYVRQQTVRQWDVLSIDCPTNLFDRCADDVDQWCRLARVAVVLGVGRETIVIPPFGWEMTGRRFRSDFHGGVYWAVLERAG